MAIELDYMEYSTDVLAQQAYASSDVVPNPVSQWKLNDNAANTTVVDSAGTNTGTASRNTNLLSSSGKINTAFLFVRSSQDYVWIGDAASTKPSPNISFGAWFKTSTTDVGQYVIRWRTYGYGVAINANSSLSAFVYTSSSVQLTWTSLATYTDGNWHHAFATCDGSVLRVYVDGELAGTVTGGAGAIYYGSGGLGIAREGDYNGNHFDGKIDDVRLYNIVLNEEEVKAIYREGNGTEDKNPQRYLACFSESTIKQQGSYSLKGKAAATDSLNDTLTRTISSPIDLSNQMRIKYWVRASRTGSNIKVSFRDSGGYLIEHTPNIVTANAWEEQTVTISSVANADKDAIDRIIITIVNADADNIFYLDGIFSPHDFTKNFTETIVLSEPVFIKGISKTFQDGISLIDTFLRQWSINRIFTEIISLTDTFLKQWSIKRVFTETITVVDNIIKGIGKTFTDGISLTDILKTIGGWVKKIPLITNWQKKDKADTDWQKKDKNWY